MPRPDENAPPPGPSPFARGPTGMSGAFTLFLGLALLGLLFALSLNLPDIGRGVVFQDVSRSASRVFERRLELAAALKELPAWERDVLAPFVPAGATTAEEAVEAFGRIVDAARQAPEDETEAERAGREGEVLGLRARRALLFAELGRAEEAQGDLDAIERAGRADFVAAFRALERGSGDPAALALAGDGWIARWAVARASGRPDPAPDERASSALRAVRATALLVLAGVAVLLAWLARGRPPMLVSSVAIPPPWSPQTGFGVLVRFAFAGLAIGFALDYARTSSGMVWLAVAQVVLASLPLFFLVRRHLLTPHDATLADISGIPVARSTALLATLGLFGLERLGGMAFATAASSLGASDPWFFHVSDVDLFAPDAVYAATVIASLTVGVAAQELALRGVLFPSLRYVHGPVHAAVLTGLLYSAVHVASFPQMMALAWTGFVYALSVERTRSLLPAALCASLGVALDSTAFALIYR